MWRVNLLFSRKLIVAIRVLNKKKSDTTKPEKKNWYADRYQFVVVQRNLLAIITIISLLSSLVAAFSISQLAPLKSVEPFVIQIDQKSGITQVVNPITATEFSGNEAVNEYFIVQFIRARESIGIADNENYNTVRVMSDPLTVFREYLRDIDPNNPKGIRAVTGNGFRAVRIGQIVFLEERTDIDGSKIRRYQIRMIVTERSANREAMEINKVATIEIKFVALSLSIQDRYLNPIGFRVVSYRTDEDALVK
jgi:type IV secretion system protein VirB8